MERVERVRILKTLKCGNTTWDAGAILFSPIPKDVEAEIRANTGTVEVMSPPPNARKDRDGEFYCEFCTHRPFKTEAAKKAHITKYHEPNNRASENDISPDSVIPGDMEYDQV